jgi:hypothetical protein
MLDLNQFSIPDTIAHCFWYLTKINQDEKGVRLSNGVIVCENQKDLISAFEEYADVFSLAGFDAVKRYGHPCSLSLSVDNEIIGKVKTKILFLITHNAEIAVRGLDLDWWLSGKNTTIDDALENALIMRSIRNSHKFDVSKSKVKHG